MKLSKDSRNTAKQLFQASFVDGRLQADRLRQAASLVIERKPRNYVGILKEIHRLARLEIARHHAIIQSAAQISPGEANQLAGELKSRYGNDLTTEFAVDPSLLGGLRIQIANDVIDGSVKARLQLLENSLTH